MSKLPYNYAEVTKKNKIHFNFKAMYTSLLQKTCEAGRRVYSSKAVKGFNKSDL